MSTTRRSTKPSQRPALRWTPELAALPALSLRQPYAWLVTQGIKDVENRSRRLVTLPKRVLIHASASTKYLSPEVAEEIEEFSGYRLSREQDFEMGGIIGVATIIACEQSHTSRWKDPDSWAWVLVDAAPLRYRPCKGAVGFFYPDFASDR